MTGELIALATTAAAVGIVHALLGPDHYLPLIVLSKSRRWNTRRTSAVTLACGAGHIAGSVVLGGLALALGWRLQEAIWWETMRGQLAGWLLLGFGLAYSAWGLRRALRGRPHSHWHEHVDGTFHCHGHAHADDHAHLHEAPAGAGGRSLLAGASAWSLFVVFVLGPCEPLVPMLMVPAATGSLLGAVFVALVFAAATLATMMALVLAGRRGLTRFSWVGAERWAHAAAGLVVVACGVAIQFGL